VGDVFYLRHTVGALDEIDYWSVADPYRLPVLGIPALGFLALLVAFGGIQGVRGLAALVGSRALDRISRCNKIASMKTTLQKAGLKATAPRTRLIETLAREEKPIAAAEVAKKLKGEMDEVTVYRNLEALADARVVSRSDFHHGHAEYELSSDRPHHHHLVCEQCGKTEDIPLCPAQAIEQRIITRSRNFINIRSHALEFFGLCTRCA
jgi:Fe2+ or Zn2+ uptake regulation protein